MGNRRRVSKKIRAGGGGRGEGPTMRGVDLAGAARHHGGSLHPEETELKMTAHRADMRQVIEDGRPPRLTVVRSGGLGDTMLMLPTLQSLLRECAEAELTFVGSAWAEAVLPLVPFPLRLVRFDSPEMTPLFAPDCRHDPVGAFRKADTVVVYSVRAGDPLVENARRLCPGPVIWRSVHPPAGKHAAVHFAGAFSAQAGHVQNLSDPPLSVPCNLRHEATRWLHERGAETGSALAVHPGSGGRRKCWPLERFAVVAEELGLPVVAIEGPADAEACRNFAEALPSERRPVVARNLSIPPLGALLQQCRIFLGNDSGVSHLAAALGTPTVAVFGPTDPVVWRPLGQRVQIVVPESPGEDWPEPARVVAACRLLMT